MGNSLSSSTRGSSGNNNDNRKNNNSSKMDDGPVTKSGSLSKITKTNSLSSSTRGSSGNNNDNRKNDNSSKMDDGKSTMTNGSNRRDRDSSSRNLNQEPKMDVNMFQADESDKLSTEKMLVDLEKVMKEVFSKDKEHESDDDSVS